MPMLLNAPGLHRVPSMTEYVWITPGHACLCLNMPDYDYEYTQICEYT